VTCWNLCDPRRSRHFTRSYEGLLLPRPLFIDDSLIRAFAADLVTVFHLLVSLPKRIFNGSIDDYCSAVGITGPLRELMIRGDDLAEHHCPPSVASLRRLGPPVRGRPARDHGRALTPATPTKTRLSSSGASPPCQSRSVTVGLMCLFAPSCLPPAGE
jgi:hypothetical protein